MNENTVRVLKAEENTRKLTEDEYRQRRARLHCECCHKQNPPFYSKDGYRLCQPCYSDLNDTLSGYEDR